MAASSDGAGRAVLTLTVDVRAPAALTWEAATDWARQGEWMFATAVTSEGEGVGSSISAFTGLRRLRLGFLDTMTVTAWDPPRECRVLHTGRVVRGDGVFAVIERGPLESTFVWTEELDLPLGVVGRLGWPLVRPAFAAGVSASLRRFARWTEARA